MLGGNLTQEEQCRKFSEELMDGDSFCYCVTVDCASQDGLRNRGF